MLALYKWTIIFSYLEKTRERNINNKMISIDSIFRVERVRVSNIELVNLKAELCEAFYVTEIRFAKEIFLFSLPIRFCMHLNIFYSFPGF